jgi:hypothetical protein
LIEEVGVVAIAPGGSHALDKRLAHVKYRVYTLLSPRLLG